MSIDYIMARIIRTAIAFLVVQFFSTITLVNAIEQQTPFPLLEASGAQTGSDVVASVGVLCNEPALLLIDKNNGYVRMLRGPSPYVVAEGQYSSLVGAKASLIVSYDETQPSSTLVTLESGGVALVKTNTVNGKCNITAIPASVYTKPYKILSMTLFKQYYGLGILQQDDGSFFLADISIDSLSDVVVTKAAENTSLGPLLPTGFAWVSLATYGEYRMDDNNQYAVGVAYNKQAGMVLLRSYSVNSSAVSVSNILNTITTMQFTMTTAPISMVFSDVYGDGAPSVMMFEDDGNMTLAWMNSDGSLLTSNIFGPFKMEAANHPVKWGTAVAGKFFTNASSEDAGALILNNTLPQEEQLIAIRASTNSSFFQTNVLVYGRHAHWTLRRKSFQGLQAQQEFKVSFNDSAGNVGNLSGPLTDAEIDQIKNMLTSTNTNTYAFSICDCDLEPGVWGRSKLWAYSGFIKFLMATQGFQVNGQQLRVWAGLLPPSEDHGTGACRPPPDLPNTPMNETAIFDGLPYSAYAKWGELLGRLATLYPHLVSVDVDDFNTNVGPGQVFYGDAVAQMTSAMRKRAPWLTFNSVVYAPFDGVDGESSRSPDLALILDAPVFFFRNAGQGAGPCARPECPWGPFSGKREGQCLAGVCSEPTVFNLGNEVEAIVQCLPYGRRTIVGYYATGHSSGGQPTARYVSRLLQAISTTPMVDGIMTYTLKSAVDGCSMAPPPLFGRNNDNSTLQRQLGCIVAENY
eukprot:m.47008 g.47008  ORF g.47008 m.47008 type:complete len:744 (-) comp10436_c0_seq2:87-2318(-)